MQRVRVSGICGFLSSNASVLPPPHTEHLLACSPSPPEEPWTDLVHHGPFYVLENGESVPDGWVEVCCSEFSPEE